MSPTLPQLSWLVRSVARLALPASAQAEYLRRLGTAPSCDELALEFADSYVLAAQFVEAEVLTNDEKEVLDQINAMLTSMAGQDWLVHDLETSAEWGEVRATAQRFFVGLVQPESGSEIASPR